MNGHALHFQTARWLVLGMWLGVALGSGAVRAADPPITALAFRPDGRILYSGSQAGLKALSWPDLKILTTFPADISNIHDIRMSPNGSLLAVAGGEPAEIGCVEIFDHNAHRQMRNESHEDVVYAVVWDKSGQSVLTASLDGTCRQIEVPTGRVLREFVGHARGVTSCGFADESTVVTAGIDHSLRVWNTLSGESVRSLDNHKQAIHTLAVRPGGDGRLPMVATASADGTVRFWQPTIGRMVRFVLLPAEPLSLDWLPDGSALAAASSDGCVRLISPDTAQVIQQVTVLDGWAFCLAVHPSRNEIAVGGADGRIYICRVSKGQLDQQR